MERKFSPRKALANPAVVREVIQHYRLRLQSPDEHTQLRAAKSLLALAIYLIHFNGEGERA